MSLYQGLAGLRARLFGERGAPSPAQSWLARREKASPEEVVREYFRAINAHDLDWILATLTPERARLYSDPRTTDRNRKTIIEATVHRIAETHDAVPLPAYIGRYRSVALLKADYELKLVPQDQRRDPTLREGPDWSYFVLVTESRGKAWLIADWGR